jgi:hypothetical protein
MHKLPDSLKFGIFYLFIVRGRGGGRKGRDFREILGERVVWGNHFWAREREKLCQMIYNCVFIPLFGRVGQKNAHNCSNDLFGPILGIFYLLFAFFAIIALILTFSVIFFTL